MQTPTPPTVGEPVCDSRSASLSKLSAAAISTIVRRYRYACGAVKTGDGGHGHCATLEAAPSPGGRHAGVAQEAPQA